MTTARFRGVLKDTVKEFEPYERVLQEVVDKTDIFISVKDCMDRCDALSRKYKKFSTGNFFKYLKF